MNNIYIFVQINIQQYFVRGATNIQNGKLKNVCDLVSIANWLMRLFGKYVDHYDALNMFFFQSFFVCF